MRVLLVVICFHRVVNSKLVSRFCGNSAGGTGKFPTKHLEQAGLSFEENFPPFVAAVIGGFGERSG